MIYFIKAEDYIKIGYSKNQESLKHRLRSYNTSCPFDIEIINIIDGGVDLEKNILNHFIQFHKKGEWFIYNESIVDFAKNPYKLKQSTISKPTNNSHKIITDNLTEIIQEYKQGYSLKILAEKYNVNRKRLTQYIPEELKRKKNGWFSLRKRETNPKNKQIICITTNKIFNSIKEASRELNIPCSSISKVCRGERNHAHNLTFKFL